MEKFLKVLMVLGLGLIGFSIYSFIKKAPSDELQKAIAKAQSVDGGVYLINPMIPKGVATYRDYKIEEKDWDDDPVLQGLEHENNELILIDVIKEAGSTGENVTLYLDRPKRKIKDILNQYGVGNFDEKRLQFNDTDEKQLLAKIGQKNIYLKDLQRAHFLWGALQTKKFLRTLELIRKKAFHFELMKKAKEEKLSGPEYIEKKILSGADKALEKEKQIDQYFAKLATKSPIEINLEIPQFPIEVKEDWTPSLGKKGALKKMIVFDNFYSQWAREFFKKLPEISIQFPQIYFGFRPVFSAKDQYQNMLSQMGFCIWVNHPENYFKFMAKAVGFKQLEFEKKMYSEIEKQGMNLEVLKNCFYKKEYENIVQYHLDYARYLGIKAGPVIYYDGKVYTGGPSVEDLQKIIGFWK